MHSGAWLCSFSHVSLFGWILFFSPLNNARIINLFNLSILLRAEELSYFLTKLINAFEPRRHQSFANCFPRSYDHWSRFEDGLLGRVLLLPWVRQFHLHGHLCWILTSVPHHEAQPPHHFELCQCCLLCHQHCLLMLQLHFLHHREWSVSWAVYLWGGASFSFWQNLQLLRSHSQACDWSRAGCFCCVSSGSGTGSSQLLQIQKQEAGRYFEHGIQLHLPATGVLGSQLNSLDAHYYCVWTECDLGPGCLPRFCDPFHWVGFVHCVCQECRSHSNRRPSRDLFQETQEGRLVHFPSLFAVADCFALLLLPGLLFVIDGNVGYSGTLPWAVFLRKRQSSC